MDGLLGIPLSAGLLHWIGRCCLRGPIKRALGRTTRKLEEALHDRSILTVATIRMMPVAPGLTMMALFGRQVRMFWKNPTWAGVLLAVLVAALWGGISLGLQRWAAKRRKRSSSTSSSKTVRAAA